MSQILVSMLVLAVLFGTATYPMWMLIRPIAETTERRRVVLLFCIFLGGVMGLVIGGTHDAMLGKFLAPLTTLPVGLIVGPYIGIALTVSYYLRSSRERKDAQP
jgi:F0F1-type ATP synthase assembly protein I